MANPKKATKAPVIWKKKRWYRLIAPEMFKNAVIGETPAYNPDDVQNRFIKVNLMHLTRNIKDQNTNVKFQVEKVAGDQALTFFKSYEIVPASIKRFVRRRSNRIDESLIMVTADKKKIRIKPMLITYNQAKGSQLQALRKIVKSTLLGYISKTNYNNLVQDIVTKKLQREIRERAKKIYPIKICEIRTLKLEGVEKGTKQVEEKKAEEKPENVEPKKEKKAAAEASTKKEEAKPKEKPAEKEAK